MKRKLFSVMLILAIAITSTVTSFAYVKGYYAKNVSVYTSDASNKFELSYELIRGAFSSKSKGIIIVNGDSNVDITSAINLVNKYKYPLVYVNKKYEGQAVKKVKEQLKLHKISKFNVLIVGGTGVVSGYVDQEFKKVKGVTVKRYAGKDRFQTNDLTLKPFNLKKNYGVTIDSNDTGRVLAHIQGHNSLVADGYIEFTRSTTKRILKVRYEMSSDFQPKRTVNVVITSAKNFPEAVLAYAYAKSIMKVDKDYQTDTIFMYAENNNYKHLNQLKELKKYGKNNINVFIAGTNLKGNTVPKYVYNLIRK